MSPKEASVINTILAGIGGRNEPLEVFIDNLHTPYFEFSKSYELPSISISTGVDFTVCKEYLQAVSRLIPELIRDTYILPKPLPRKENQKIFLVRSLSSPLSQKFLWILSLQIGYLGGGSKESILRPRTQGWTPSVRTNRIYFQSRVIPVETLVYEGKEILGFHPYKISEPIGDSELEKSTEARIQPFSELFDEPDLTKQDEKIQRIYKLSPQIWQPGSVYAPIGIEYKSLSFRFLEADFARIQSIWEEISPAFWLAATLSSDSLEEKPVSEEISLYALHRYLSRFKSESSYSPSGNLRWKILIRNGN